MKPIKITDSNAAAIVEALRQVNGKAEAHAYTTYSEIAKLAASAESTAVELLNKGDLPGARWVETSGGKTANSYKYMRDATTVTIERRSSAWYLIDVKAARIGTSGGGAGRLYLTGKQADAARAKLAQRFTEYASEEK